MINFNTLSRKYLIVFFMSFGVLSCAMNRDSEHRSGSLAAFLILPLAHASLKFAMKVEESQEVIQDNSKSEKEFHHENEKTPQKRILPQQDLYIEAMKSNNRAKL